MKSAAEAMKTYQATFLMTTDGGDNGKMTLEMKLKTDQKRVNLAVAAVGTATGRMKVAASATNMQLIDDGKKSYTYLPVNKVYRVGPTNGGKTNLPIDMVKGDIKKMAAGYKMLPEETVAGHRSFVLGTSQGGVSMKIYVDKDTYRMRQMVMNMTGNNPNSKAGAISVKSIMTVKSEIVNAPIKEGDFVFTPPAGATEFKPTAAPPTGIGAPGQAPGLGKK